MPHRQIHSAHRAALGVCSACARLVICVVALLLLGLALWPQAVQARDAVLPYVESLQVTQQRAYVKAAPSGQDEALIEPDTTLQAPAYPLAEEPSRLEIRADAKTGPLSLDERQQSQVLAEELSQFGYDIFRGAPSTFAPVEGIPVPQNYRIGPGDSIVVQLYGKRNVEYRLVVTRDGNILVPEYGPVKISGLTFDEAEQLLTDGFERRVIGAKAVVTMGNLRTIQIRLAGDVKFPGVYKLGGLSTLIDALLTTGGVRPTGSLRNIELIRGGKKIATLDLYDLLLGGHSDEDIYLSHADTIFVPSIGAIAYVGGEVQRPAIYELKGGETVQQLVTMAGGLLSTASLEHSHIERIQSKGTRTLIDFSQGSATDRQQAALATSIRNGDFLRILPLEDELEDVVMLSGHVKRPGGYQFRTGMRLSELLPNADALLPGADLDFVLIKREQSATLRTEVIYANLLQAMSASGSESDIALSQRDQVIVFDLSSARANDLQDITTELEVQATTFRPASTVEIQGSSRFNGKLPLQEGSRLLDVIRLAGGTSPGTELNYGVRIRTLHPSGDITADSFNTAGAMADPNSSYNIEITPGDRLYFFDEQQSRSELLQPELDKLRMQSNFGAHEAIVTALGEVNHSGDYPLAPGMRASDLLCAARGLSRKAYGLGASLSRIEGSAGGSNTVTHIPLDSGELIALCQFQIQLARGSAGIAHDNPLAQQYTNESVNPTLQPMDQLTFTEKAGWVEQASVTLSGEVMRPGVYAIDRGESLCTVLNRAGGLTADAYQFGAYFTRRSVREMQQETIDELHDQLDDLMIELSLSHSFNNEEKSAPEWGGKQDYLKTIRQLERAEANGRMVVDLDRVLKCKSQDAFVLEDGDSLNVPSRPDYVQVAGQVYVPTSHLYANDRKIEDYVELSGGSTVLGRLKDTYVIQANGEVLNYKGSRTSSRIARKTVMPGAKIYVPLNVDRMNTTEKAQSWVSSLIQSAILAGIVL